MVKKYKKYVRWCARCEEQYETEFKYSRFCKDCHLPSGGAVVVAKERFSSRINPTTLKEALLKGGWIKNDY